MGFNSAFKGLTRVFVLSYAQQWCIYDIWYLFDQRECDGLEFFGFPLFLQIIMGIVFWKTVSTSF